MRRLTTLLVLVLIMSACGNLGLGEADCSARVDDSSSTTILIVQAVPGANYTPCLNELRLGWDSINWFAEDGRAGIEIKKSFNTFLTATVTESCEVSHALPVDSGHPDIERFDDVSFQPTEIEVVIVPSGQEPLGEARRLLKDLAGVEIDDRPVKYSIKTAVDDSVGSRVDAALMQVDYVWIIDEVDVEEGTVQLRSNDSRVSGRGLQPLAALDLIEDVVPDVFYRGNWYFTFEGGCITYEFDAKGQLAETVAADAADALGFYPAFELRGFANDAGFDIG